MIVFKRCYGKINTPIKGGKKMPDCSNGKIKEHFNKT